MLRIFKDINGNLKYIAAQGKYINTYFLKSSRLI